MSEKLILFFSMDNLDIRTQNEIYNEFYYLVYDTVFYIIRDPASVEDMIHESLLKAIDSPPEYVDPNKIKGWLKAIARNHCLNYVRKHKKSGINSIFNRLMNMTSRIFSTMIHLLNSK